MISNIKALPTRKQTAWIFPGQGSQYSEMAKDFYDFDDDVKDLFNTVEKITNQDFTKILFNNSEDSLKKTNNAQMAIFLHSVSSIIVAINQKKITYKPELVAGHSLGELTALYIAGYIDLESIINMIMIRSNEMQKSCNLADSGMAAIIKLKRIELEKIIGKYNIWICNENADGNISIGGLTRSLNDFRNVVSNIGGKFIQLNVAGAFHTPLMNDAKIAITGSFNKVAIHTSDIAILSNISGNILKKNEIHDELINQITSTVEWLKIMNKINDLKIKKIVEFGPGKILTNLFIRNNQEIDIVSIDKMSDISKAEL
jgi:[acyl-carrier-protein] S-malonyltransferase